MLLRHDYLGLFGGMQYVQAQGMAKNGLDMIVNGSFVRSLSALSFIC